MRPPPEILSIGVIKHRAELEAHSINNQFDQVMKAIGLQRVTR